MTLPVKKSNNAPARILAEACGWYGMVAIVGAYALVSFDILQPDGLAYQLLNLSGALGLMIISLVKKVRQTVVLNLFWGGIAVAAIIGLLF